MYRTGSWFVAKFRHQIGAIYYIEWLVEMKIVFNASQAHGAKRAAHPAPYISKSLFSKNGEPSILLLPNFSLHKI